jgi:predicted O-methyltransferase YrrM
MNPITINHFNRRKEFIQMLAKRGAKIGVEVGTDHGKYAQQLCEGIPGLFLSCVDPWTPYTEGNEVHDEVEIEQIYQEAIKRLEPYNGQIFRKTSMEAVKAFLDNSLDFVFIDGNHSYEYVKEDIREWTKKVKPGGIIAGHDYKEDSVNNYGVIQAVNEYVEENNIDPLFILHTGGSFVDCWMFIKQ